MKIEKWNGESNIAFRILGIEGDMGEATHMDLIQQGDGDVIVRLQDLEKGNLLNIEFCSSNGGGRQPFIAKKLRELIAELRKDEALKVINPIKRMGIGECTEDNPCCDKRNIYNGFGSGTLLFVCPNHCSCHD